MKKVLLSLVIVVGVGFLAVSLFLDTIAASAVEKIASKTLKTEVTVGSMDISLLSQNVTVRDLKIKNPEGYTAAENILEMPEIRVTAESLMSDPIIMKEISVTGLQANMEMKNGRTNVRTLQSNMQSGSSAQQTASNQTSSGSEEPAEKAKGIVIRDLKIADAKAVSAISLGQESQSAAISLPTIHMTNLGSEDAALEPPEAIKRVMNKLSQTIVASTSQSFIDDLTRGVGDKINEKLNGFFSN